MLHTKTLKDEWYARQGRRRRHSHFSALLGTCFLMFCLLVFLETNPSLRERIIAQVPEPSPPHPVESEQAANESPPPREVPQQEQQAASQQADRAPSETAPSAPADEATTGSTQKGSGATEAETRERSRAASAFAIAEADQLLQRGDVAGARLWLSAAADRGDAEATFRLAETYDPGILRQWGVVGLQGDPGKARELYAKASEAGYRAAQERLAHVGE